ncbi:MAG: hypothetical protein L0Y71_00655 [Gemmataceae bacterium]|nr:hypothetical protein [Gemmataceae bacterium]
MSRALGSWCRCAALLAATLALALLVVGSGPRPVGPQVPEDDELCAALGAWLEDGDSRTLEERTTAVHAFRKLLQEAADAVVAQERTLEDATRQLHDFCVARCPEQLRYNKFYFKLDSALTETRVNLLWHIRVGLARGQYREVPAALEGRFAEIPPRLLNSLADLP